MIKNCIFLMIVLMSGSACAKNKCVDINGEQSYPPLSIKNGTVCFIRGPTLDYKTGVSIGVDSISLYYIANGNAPVKVEGGGLLYDDTPGEIIDAFLLSVGRDRREKVFVIHSMEVRYSLAEPNSSGKFYSVLVFDPVGSTLHRDERASDWFGAGYSWLSDGRRIIYKFPYQSKKDVRQAIDSPFALLANRGDRILVKVKFKSYLFEEPNIRSKTNKYLVEGDRATVDNVTAGWCQVNGSRGTQSLKVWVMCDSLDVEAQGKI
jgi:hypothetical protein